LRRYHFSIDPRVPVGTLGIGLQQMVEIVRALSFDARVLVLDEPTAALTAGETERLLGWLRELRGKGTTMIYVTHRMDEVFALCDRITVLRDGKTAKTFVTREASADEVVAAMVGRSVARGEPPRTEKGEKVLEVSDLSMGDVLDRVSLSVRAGEIVAVAGAMGSGRTALLSALFGCAEETVNGWIKIDGQQVDLDSPRAAIDRGVALIPEDRKGRGLVLDMTVAENLAIPTLGPMVDAAGEEALAEKRIRELRIRGQAEAPVATLSGGNQQKVVLGKWLEQPPKVLLLDEPTRGVDVGAREEIYGLLEALLRKGTAILMASSDLAEVVRLAHRTIVLRDGKIAGELGEATEADIVRLSSGLEAIQ
jgi:ABC-type sugar transport system ATPase subunit